MYNVHTNTICAGFFSMAQCNVAFFLFEVVPLVPNIIVKLTTSSSQFQFLNWYFNRPVRCTAWLKQHDQALVFKWLFFFSFIIYRIFLILF